MTSNQSAPWQWAYPEPHPDWQTALPIWGPAWHVHIYGTGSLFAVLAGYDVIVAFRLGRRLRTKPFLLAIFVLSAILAGVEFVSLIVDPYGSRDLLPIPVIQSLRAMTSPCLTATLGALEIVIVGMTKSTFGARLTPTQTAYAVGTVAHVTCSLTSYNWASVDRRMRPMILLSQAVYITSGLALCLIYTYNGYRISEYTARTSRLLRQINSYSRHRRHNGHKSRSHLAMIRIGTPHVRATLPSDGHSASGPGRSAVGSDEDCSGFGSDSSETLSEPTARGRDELAMTSPLHENRYTFGDSQLSLDLTSESDDVSGGRSARNAERVVAHGDVVVTSSLSEKIRKWFSVVVASRRRRPINGCQMAFTKVPSKYINGHVNKAYRRDFTSGLNAAPTHALCSTDFQDGGYMADTEVAPPRDGRKRKRSRGREAAKMAADENDGSDGSDGGGAGGSADHFIPVSFPLPVYTGSLGLRRIRQGRVLSRVHKIAYIAVVFVFCTCVLQVYAMFGDLGVLAKNKMAEPWSWLIFNGLSRLCEFSAICVMAVVAHKLASQRYRIRRKRTATNILIQTRC